MIESEQKSLLAIAITAACADGAKSDSERDAIRKMAAGLPEAADDLAVITQDVLLKRVSLAQWCAGIAAQETRLLAYEMALGVCEADDVLGPQESAFLAELREHLGLQAPDTAEADAAAAGLTAMPPALPAAAAVPAVQAAAPAPDGAEVDRMVLNYAILNGALEMLPDTLSTMAILPVQMKMVYRIGTRHGFQLDRGHIKELIATAGVGLTSQVLEGYAQKLVKGLLGRFGGKTIGGGMGRKIGAQATSSLMSFATTYALGQLAKRYYAGGRSFSQAQIKESYQACLAEAKDLQTQYLPQIEERSKTLSVKDLLPMLKSGQI